MNKNLHLKVKSTFLLSFILLVSLTFGVVFHAEASDGVVTNEMELQQESKTVTLNLKKASIQQIFQEIQKQTRINFVYKDEEIKTFGLKDIRVTKTPIKDVLADLFANSNFSYTINGNTIVVTKKESPKGGTAVAVKGKILDSSKKPIAGATIIVKGTPKGAITDVEGRFSLNANISQELEITYLGMKPLVQKITDAKEMVLVMYEDALAVDDVVVTGLFERKKESFTGSSSTFTSKELKNVGTQNILQSLKSLDPALMIVENNQYGSDPNRMPDMEIRGKSSVVGLKEQFGEDPNQPLFILDGFETTLSVIMDLSLDRVASVTILKDAASTAIYGAKAANGVIVVETKAPEKGKLRLSYNGNFILSFADLSAYNLMNSAEKLEFELRAGRFETNSPTQQEELNNRYNYYANEIKRGVDTYWLAEPLRYGVNHRHGVTVEGGDDKMRYGAGFSYNGNNGVMKKSDRDVISGNLDLLYRNGNLSFSNKMTIDYLKSENPVVAFSQFSRANPYYKKTNDLGGYDKFLENSQTIDNPFHYNPQLYQVPNPMWNYMQSSYDQSNEFAFRNNTSLEYRILKSLRARMRLSINKSTSETEKFMSPEDTRFENVELVRKGTYQNSRSDGFGYSGDMSITYGELIGKRHQINAVLGASLNQNANESKSYNSEGFPNGGFSLPSFANQYPEGSKPSYSDYLKRSTSVYFNGGYSYDNRYLMDVNLRLDGSSVFGSNRRFTNTWSVGLAWNLHNEAFMENTKSLINLLKIRASIGNPGNQNFGSFQAITTYSFNNWMMNNFGTGVLVSAFGNNDLDWQKTMDKNIGIDLTMFNNRLRVNADYYDKLTDPLLASVTIPLSVGTSTKLMNIGNQISRGVNATVGYAVIYKPQSRINWTMSVSMRNNTSYFDNIGDQLSQSNKDNLTKSLVRYYDKAKTSYLWSVRSLGIDPTTGRELFLTKDGDYTFDYLRDDEVVVGDSNPTLDGVYSNSFRYKGLSVSLSVRYSFGGDAFNSTLHQKVENISNEGLKGNQDKRALYDRWQKPGDNAKFKAINLMSTTRISSRFVQPNDYLSIESIRVGYEFDSKWISNLGISGLNVNAYMNEIWRIGTMKTERGIDYPFARSVSFSLSFNF